MQTDGAGLRGNPKLGKTESKCGFFEYHAPRKPFNDEVLWYFFGSHANSVRQTGKGIFQTLRVFFG